MRNPGALSLGDLTIGGASTQIGPVISDLQGMGSLSLQARFSLGTPGASCKAYIQTSLDQGQTWFDIACFAFTTTGDTRVLNLSAAVALPVPTQLTDGSLADNTVLAGPLGDRLRPKVVSVGTYSNQTLLSLWAVVR